MWNQIDASLHGTRNPFEEENLATDLDDLLDDVDEHEASPSDLEVTAIRSLREELRLANNRLDSFRSNFYRHGSPHSRVHFVRRTTNHSGTDSKPYPIASQGSGEVPIVVDQNAHAMNQNADAHIASHNSGINASGFSSFTVSSSDLFKKLSKLAYTFEISKLTYESGPKTRRENFQT